MSERRIVCVTIQGRVQGVGFRAWTHHQAELHGLEGWVRNRRDGSVEALFAGRPDLVAAILKAVRQGPQGSRVETVEESGADATEIAEAGRFVVRPTV